MFEGIKARAAERAAAREAENKAYWENRRIQEAQERADLRSSFENATSEELLDLAHDSLVEAEISYPYAVQSEYSRHIMITNYSRTAAFGTLAILAEMKKAQE